MFIQWKRKILAGDGYQRIGPHVFDSCIHGTTGGSRFKLSPVIKRSVRKNGVSRHETLWHPGPAIRPCCIDDARYPMVRVGFWLEVFERLDLLKNGPPHPYREVLLQNERWILEELDLTVSAPTPAQQELLQTWSLMPSEEGEPFPAYLRRLYRRAVRERRVWMHGRHGHESYEAFRARTGTDAGRRARAPGSLDVEVAAALLDVSWPCSYEVLREAYRKAALRHHPDRGGDLAAMKNINIAFELLRELLE